MRKLNVFTSCKTALSIIAIAAFILSIMPTNNHLCASGATVDAYATTESSAETTSNNMSFVFDLALTKRLVGTSTPRIGDNVQFEITVINEGDHLATGYTISDDISDGFEFLPDLNPGWTLDGNMISYKETNYLVGQDQRSYIVTLKLLYGNQYDYVNISEISEAIDNFGDYDSDIDSTPDDDMTNDPQGEDDIDQDFVKIFDLALVNVLDCPDPNKTFKVGQDVCLQMRISNQGNIKASEIGVINYAMPGFTFDPVKNPDWTFNGTGYVNKSLRDVSPGQTVPISICYTVSSNINDGKFINYAEIFEGSSIDCPGAQDYDSNPDQILDNDTGGEVSTINDNNSSGNGQDDEDDHDPALIKITHLDLALKKVIENQLVTPGSIASFDVVVMNQGTEAVQSVTLVDYLPEFTSLVGTDWHTYTADPTGRTVYQTFDFPNGLKAGEMHTAKIDLRLDDDIVPMILVNYAEIQKVVDMYETNVSDLDIDSSPDGINTNDNGGVAGSSTDNQVDNDGTIDEDDHDPASIYFLNADGDGCVCRNDADINQPGLFDQDIIVTAPAGQTWTVDNVVNFYDASSANSNALVSIPIGTPLTLGASLPGGMQEYILSGSHVDGEVFYLRFVNENLDYDEHQGVACNYDKPVMSSDLAFAVCEGAEATYTVPEIVGDNCTVSWEVLDATGSPIATGTGQTFTYTWATSGDFQVVAYYNCLTSCVAPPFAIIQVGNTGGQIQCINDLNISLGTDCSAVVTPSMILAGTPLSGASYSVMLTWPDGTPIPNATLTEEHLWHDVVAKLIDGCTGNQCWATLHVEEKVSPTIDCSDTDQFCYKMDEYLPYASDNCTPVSIEQIGEVVEQLQCDANYIKTIWRTYKAVDEYGNESQPCTQKINVLRFPLQDIVPPPHFGGIEPGSNAPIQCDQLDYDENGVPDYNMTGVPTIEGEDLFPLSDDIYCKIGVTFTDYEVDTYDCGKKFMRTWTVYEDYCPTDPSSIWTFTQTIEIVDTKSPLIEAPDDITVYSTLPNCQANVALPMAVVSDNCSEPVMVNITYDFGNILENQNGGTIVLPFGTHEVTYTALDQCGNTRSVTIDVTVEDGQAPTAICDGEMTVGLREDGTAEMYAPMFDEGSTDNCQLDYMKVRRVDNTCPDKAGELEWSDFISFCCMDVDGTPNDLINETVTVEFAVWDVEGLMSSICEIEVTVQDKHGPQITAPADLTFDCSEDYSIDAILALGEPTVFDACNGTDYDYEIIDNMFDANCGNGDFYVRYFANDGFNSSEDFQLITVVNNINYNLANVNFPGDLEFINESCNLTDLSAETLMSFPTFTNTTCDVVLIGDPVDNIFYQVDSDNTCFKIIRTWTVINHCTGLTRSDDQIIRVANTIDPEVEGDLEDSYDALTCEGAIVNFEVSGDDDCDMGDLTWTYQLDANDDNEFVILPLEDIVPGNGSTINYSALLPIGNHSITFTFTDKCNNSSSLVHDFVINDEVAPDEPACIPVTISLAPWEDENGDLTIEGGCIIDVNTLIASSSHSCGDDLIVSFDEVDIVTEMCFYCEDIGVNMVEVYVIDEDGDSNFCLAEITVEDTNDHQICSELDLALIKTIDEANSTLPATIGSNVTFLIDIENQGTSVVNEISIVDYIPAGYIYNAADNSEPWVYDANTGMAILDITGLTLNPDGFLPSIPIVLEVSPDADPSNVTNVAEIKSATDALGNMNDIDSDPDMTNDDIVGGNDITDGSNDDEDDHDPETIPLFDLALIKTTDAVGPYTLNQEISFDITVSNQGNREVNNIEIVDYIPCGMAFANSSTGLTPAWTDNGDNTASATIPTTLAPGMSTTISINLTLLNVTGTCDPEEAWVNISEISDFDDADGDFVDPNDLDSTDDDNNDDNIGGDNTVDGSNGDEDDHDPEEVDVFDLALDKALVSTGAFEPGDIVEFVITVTNEANTAATNVEVTDYIQCGFAFDATDANNSAWSQVGTADPTTTIANLAVGASASVSIFLEILPEDANCPEYKNIAEITNDEDGDIDSTPGNMDMTEDDLGMDVLTLCPTAITTAPFTICEDDATVTLEATPAGGTWSGMGVDPTTGVFDPSGLSGVITISYMDDCEDKIEITVIEPVEVNLTTEAEVCNSNDTGNQPTTIDLTTLVDNQSGVWTDSNGDVVTNTTIDFTGADDAIDVVYTYTVTATSPCEDFVGTVTVDVVDCNCPMIDVEITSDDEEICVGSTAVLLAEVVSTATVSYLWSTGETTESISVSPATTTIYSVTVTDVDNDVCNDSGSFELTVNPLPTCTASAVEADICEGMDIELLGSSTSPNVSYSWTGPNGFTSSDQNPVITMAIPDQAGTYTLTIEDLDTGCESECQVMITVFPEELTCPTFDKLTLYLDEDGFVNVNDTLQALLPLMMDCVTLTATINNVDDLILDCGEIGVECYEVEYTLSGAVGIVDCIFPLQVLDTIQPVITCPVDLTIDCNDLDIDALTDVSLATGEDNCDDFVITNEVETTGVGCDITSVEITWIITDNSMLADTCMQIITLTGDCMDSDPVVLDCPEDLEFIEDLECDGELVDIFDYFDFTNTPECCGEPEFSFTVNSGAIVDSNLVTFPTSGIYEVMVEVSDDCGMDACTFEVVLADSLQVRCNKVITFIDTDGLTEFNPWDFILGASEMNGVIDWGNVIGCQGDILIPIESASFDPTVLDTLLQVTCDSVNVVIDFELYITSPLGIDTCDAAFFLNDFPAPNNICPTNIVDGGNITGLITTENDETIENVVVGLNGSGSVDENTSEFGFYAFPTMPMGGNYVVAPMKDHDDLNGVSTLDLIKIQRHVLGIEVLDSPYKIIAADANGSDDVTILDVLELRKLILGIYSELPQNTSWRMVDANHTFADPLQPFLFDLPETYPIQSLESNMQIDFIGVKVGDVNGNAATNTLNSNDVETRSSEDYVLTTQHDHAGETKRIRFGSSDLDLIYGFQMTLTYDRYAVEVIDVLPNPALVDYFGAFIGDGYITISLSSPNEITLDELETFFDIKYRSQDHFDFNLSSEYLASEAYLESGIAALRLEASETMIDGLMQVAQNNPNPWSQETSINLTLSQDSEINMVVYSSDGKQVFEINEFRNAGLSKIILNKTDLPSGGVYHYRITAGNETITKRFLLLK